MLKEKEEGIGVVRKEATQTTGECIKPITSNSTNSMKYQYCRSGRLYEVPVLQKRPSQNASVGVKEK